jgi:hypothetical protein
MAKETCDKCDCEVTVQNCSITMHCIAWDEPYAGLLSRRRCIRCSPSRAQHIVHPDFEPVVDDRSQFDKRNPEVFPTEEKRMEWEKRWTAAWLICQQPEIAEAVMQKLCNRAWSKQHFGE